MLLSFWVTHTCTHPHPRKTPLSHNVSPVFPQNLSIDTDLHAANGKRTKALDIFAYALAFFKEQALKVSSTAHQTHHHTGEGTPLPGLYICPYVSSVGMGIRLNCLNRSSGELTIDFRLIINIFILKFTIYRLY